MIKYIKNELKHIPIMIVIFILLYGITTLATNYLFNSSYVQYDNSTSGIQAGDVQGAIDELYACASDYAAYDTRLSAVENKIYPVGSIYISVSNTNPATLFGGTWEAFGTGKTLVGVDTNDTDFDTVEETGGNKSHQHAYGLQIYESWSYHKIYGLLNYTSETAFSIATGSNTGYANSGVQNSFAASSKTINMGIDRLTANTSKTSSLQPYITVYMWKRTA